MGLFDKKFCDICGEKIGLLGNRKLEDGNLCKDCARKLSPFFSDRRNSTVEEIRQQLDYRKENESRLADFHPNMTFGDGKKVYVDTNSSQFIVTSLSNWRGANPDLISISRVTGVKTDIHENKTEIYYKDNDGNRRSYNPRRYECNYEFNVTITVDSPWFDKIELELSDGNRPDSPYTDLYRSYEKQMHTLSDILSKKQSGAAGQNGFTASAASASKTRKQELMEDVIKNSTWACKSCGFINHGTLSCLECGGPVSDEHVLTCAENIAKATIMMETSAAANASAAPTAPTQQGSSQSRICPNCGAESSGKFCESCGSPMPAAKAAACPVCGYSLPNNAPSPKFCPECGSPLSEKI